MYNIHYAHVGVIELENGSRKGTLS